MAIFRTLLTLSPKTAAFYNSKLPKQRICFVTYDVMANLRKFSSLEITKNIELISKEKKNVKVLNLKLTVPQKKPLVVLLSWLLAKQKHTKKYAYFYLDQGFDVLNINISPWQLLWPTKGTQVVASDILTFLDVNESYAPLLLHGFSVGGYLWGEVLVQIARNQEHYQHIIDRVAGQVWDSATDVTEFSVGFPRAVFPKNSVMQATLKQYVLYHLRTFDKVATCHYVRSSQMFHTNLIQSPALMFLSKSDPIGAEKANLRVRENWENMGIQVYWRCFEDSPHVGHYHYYPKEYMEELQSFLEKLQLDSRQEKIRAKL